MAKYKVGDKVRIVDHRTFLMNSFGEMDKWLGKVMTIRSAGYSFPTYRMEEDFGEKVFRVANSDTFGVDRYVSLRTGLLQSVADCDVKPL